MVSSKLRRLLKPILRFAEEKGSFRLRSSVEQVRYLMGKPSAARKSHAKARKEEKRAQHAIETARIRALVERRAHLVCEGCLLMPEDGVLQMDHWLGGSGRRRQEQSVPTCWMLCRRCHEDKTRNYPSAAHWNGLRRLHCLHHGYEYRPHIEHLPLPARREASTPPPPPVGVPSVQGKEQSHE